MGLGEFVLALALLAAGRGRARQPPRAQPRTFRPGRVKASPRQPHHPHGNIVYVSVASFGNRNHDAQMARDVRLEENRGADWN
ncbi:MAG: hypothetical protein H0U04_15390 [Rubrobacter sp.]|nr:hypothetical protein [Rubrobacter sp.]